MFKKNWQLKKRLCSLLLAAAITITGIPNLEVFAGSVNNADDIVSVSENSQNDVAEEENDNNLEINENESDVIEEDNVAFVPIIDEVIASESAGVSMNLLGNGRSGDTEQWVGNTVPVVRKSGEIIIVKERPVDKGDVVEEERYLLDSKFMGNDDEYDSSGVADWACALCRSLESNLKRQGKNVNLGAKAFLEFVYGSLDKKKGIIDENYGDFYLDQIYQINNTTAGNVHTAMWPATTGYALKDTKSGKRYQVNNIYLYYGQERNKIKNAIKSRGEVVTSLYRNDKICSEEGGEKVYEYFREVENFQSDVVKTELSYLNPEPQNPDYEHAVTIVGWDDNYSLKNFKQYESYLEMLGITDNLIDQNIDKFKGAWLVKDAIGVRFKASEESYYYYWVSYYDPAFSKVTFDGTVNEEENVFFYSFEAEEVEDYMHTYQYDGGGSYFMYAVDGINEAVNIFKKVDAEESLEAISFGTYTSKAQYEIQVYLNACPADGKNDVILDEESRLFEEPITINVDNNKYSEWGYYTVDLSEYEKRKEPHLDNDEGYGYFAVKIKIDNEDSNETTSFWMDGRCLSGTVPVSITNSEAKGQGYVWYENKWVDLSQDFYSIKGINWPTGTNVRIKAHTKDKVKIHVPDKAEVWKADETGDTKYSLQLKAYVGKYTEGKEELTNLQWSVDNDEIARIDQYGEVTGKETGYVNVTVQSDEFGSDTIQLMVKDVKYEDSYDLFVNSRHEDKKKVAITPEFYPEEYQPDDVSYRVKDRRYEEYIEVNGNEIKVINYNEETFPEIIPMEMVIFDGESYIVKDITINCKRYPDRVIIEKDGESIENGEIEIKILNRVQLGVQRKPEDSAGGVGWKTSNPSIACVSETGEVTAISPGEVVITAFSEDNPDEVKSTVKVIVRNSVSRIVLDKNYITLKPNGCESIEIKAEIYPKDLSGEEITWFILDMNGNDLGLYNDSVQFDERSGVLTLGDAPIHSAVYLYAECNGVKSRCYIKIDKNSEVPLHLSFVPTDTDFYDIEEKTIQAQESKEVIVYPYINGELAEKGELLFYSSSNEKVATVTNQGKVIPRQAGETSITVKTKDNESASVTLIVESKYEGETLVFDIPSEYFYMPYPIYRGVPEMLYICTKSGRQSATDFIWQSWNESIAEVDANGMVTGKKKGAVTIEAVDKYNPENSISVDVQINVKADDILVEKEEYIIAQGLSVPFDYHVIPNDADNQELHVSYDSSIIACTDTEICGISAGKTLLTIYSDDGIRKAVNVVVKEKTTAFISTTVEDSIISTIGTDGCKTKINVETYDEYGMFDDINISQKFEYISEDPTIAQVDESGIVTGYKKGTVTIKVRTTDGSNLEETVVVTVQESKMVVKALELNHNKLELRISENVNLVATVLPESLSGEMEINWKSLDEEVAVVKNGVVTAKGAGKTYIVAETIDGRKSAKCEVKVILLDSQIKLSPIAGQVLENHRLNPDSQYQIKVLGSDGKDYTSYCEFTSNNLMVCKVDENGIVTPGEWTEKGTATITAKLRGDVQGRKVSFKVNVIDEKQSAKIRIYAETSQGNQLLDEESGLYMTNDGNRKIRLCAYAEDSNGNYLPNAKLKWVVEDKTVAVVKGGKDSTADLEIVGKGNTALTCTVQDKRKITISVPIYVLDAMPVFETENLSINLQKKEAVEIPIHADENVNIKEISLAYTKQGKTNHFQGFELLYEKAPDGNGKSVYLTYDSEYLQKGDYTLVVQSIMKLEGKLKELYSGQEELVKIIEIPVKVTDQKPSVKLKIPNINVFYKDVNEKIQVTTKETIEKIWLEDYKGNGVADIFTIGEYGETLQLKTDVKILRKGNYPVRFWVKLEGYEKPISINGQIKAVVNKPKLQVVSDGLCVYKSDNSTAKISFKLLDATKGCLINEIYKVSLKNENNEGLNISKDDAEITISGLKKYGKNNLSLFVENTDFWSDKVEVKVPIVVEDSKKIVLMSDCSKVSINKKIGDAPIVHFSMKQKNLGIESLISVKVKDFKKQDTSNIIGEWVRPEDSEAIVYDIPIRFYANEKCIPGKYQAEVEIRATNREKYKKLVTIVVEEKEPTVKIALKGKIDLHNRIDTYMTGIVTLGNISGEITNVISKRDDFFVEHIDGGNQFNLWIDKNADISKKKQKVILDIYVDHDRMPETEDMVLKKAVDISLTESKLVWKKQEKPQVFYKEQIKYPNLYRLYDDAPLDVTKADLTITSVPKGMKAYIGSGNKLMRIYITDTSLKPGKYNINYTVKFHASAKDSAPIKRTITIQVK